MKVVLSFGLLLLALGLLASEIVVALLHRFDLVGFGILFGIFAAMILAITQIGGGDI